MLTSVSESSTQHALLDFLSYARRATLDVIGAAGTFLIFRVTRSHSGDNTTGFGYEINAIELGEKNELAAAFTYLLANHRATSLWRFFVHLFPILRYVVKLGLYFAGGCGTLADPYLASKPDWSEQAKSLTIAVDAMKRIGTGIVNEKKSAALKDAQTRGTSTIDRNHVAGRDLLAVLSSCSIGSTLRSLVDIDQIIDSVKANMATDLRPSQKLSDDEVAARECHQFPRLCRIATTL